MSEWKDCTIENLGKIITGKTPRTAIEGNYGGDIPFLTPSDDLSVKYVYTTKRYLTQQGLSEVKNCLIPSNSICVSCIGSDLGKVVMTQDDIVTNQQINSIVPNEYNSPDFVYYLMILVGKQLNSLSKTSTAVPIVNKKTFSEWKITIPDLPTQQRIASILSSLDAKIENNNKINAKLEEIAQNLFKEWFVDFGPFKNGKFVESELGLIPEGWRVGTLGEIANINPSRTIKKGTSAKYLDMKNMPTSGPFPAKLETKEFTGGMKFKNGDTLMARITPCLENGKVAFVNFLDNDEIGFGSTEYIVITSQNDYFPEFFYFLCRDKKFTDYAVANMNGSSGRQRVSSDSISNYKMPIPPKEIIKNLIPIKAMMETIKNNSLENQRLATLRDTLLPKLMSGEIEV